MGRVIQGTFRRPTRYTYGMVQTTKEEATMTEQKSNSEVLQGALETAAMGFVLEAMALLRENGFAADLVARCPSSEEARYNWSATVYMVDPETRGADIATEFIFHGSAFAEHPPEALVLAIKEARA